MLLLLNNSRYFDVVMRALSEALTDLGVDHRVVDAFEAGDRANVYVVCTTHERGAMPLRYVSYNFEQLTTERAWNCAFFDRLRGAEEVWDYSRENVRVLGRVHGIRDVRHVPFGWARCMEGEAAPKTLDVLFLGRLDGRRSGVVAGLRGRYAERPQRIMVGGSCWGEALRAAQARTRVGLNVHVYERGSILEVHRIVPLVANRAWVLTERSSDAWYDELMAPAVQYVESPGQMLSEAERVLAMPEAEFAAEVERRRRYLVARCRYVDSVRSSGSAWVAAAGEKPRGA